MSITKLQQRAARNNINAVQKSERTRRAIVNSALELLWSRPFREITVADLMSVAGASRPTFYQYFDDLYDLMDIMLLSLEEDILEAATPWFVGEGDPKSLLKQSLSELVSVCYENGPILRAVFEASVTDERLELSWSKFIATFDDAVTTKIEQHQAQGLIPAFSPRSVAIALNRLDSLFLIESFGHHPRSNKELVRGTLIRVWMSTLYPSNFSPRDK